MKITKKTFQDIKKKLLPNSKMAAVDFISICKIAKLIYSEIKHDSKRNRTCKNTVLEAYLKLAIKSYLLH